MEKQRRVMLKLSGEALAGEKKTGSCKGRCKTGKAVS